MPGLSLLVARTGGGAGGGCGAKPSTIQTTAAAALRPSTDTEDEEDDGPFFDLELPFSLPRGRSPTTASGSDSDDDQRELRSVASSSERTSYGLFFKGGLFSLDRASFSRSSSEPGSKPTTRFPDSLLRSASRLRAFKLGPDKLEVDVPLAALFTRENSSRSAGNWKSARLLEAERSPSPEQKKAATHQAIQKYLSKIKPLYFRVFARRGARQVGPSEDEPASLHAGLRVVVRRLRKSRSASPPPLRRDDTLLEKQAGIQSAIAHCKRSLINRESEPPLVRSRSDPGEGWVAERKSGGG